MTKSDLRKLFLEKRASLASGDRTTASEQIAERFFDSVGISAAVTLHTFIRIGKFNEIDTSIIYHKIWRDHPDIMTVAPRAELTIGDLVGVAFDREADWSENAWGISEPVGGQVIEPSQLDVVLVPLLCFDEQGYRVGYGKGMYDRFLARCRPDCIKVGLSYFPPVEAIDDIGEYDDKLDMCITPGEVYSWGKVEASQTVTPSLAS